MNVENMNVLINIIGAVESGGQVYGKRRYAAYTPPYTNTAKEHTVTLGWAQNYGNEGRRLVQMIFTSNPAEFRKIDTAGIEQMLDRDWELIRWDPTKQQGAILIKLIDSDIGHNCQDALFADLMESYLKDGVSYTHDVKALMMYCEIRHLGGKSAADRIFKKCRGDYALSNIMAVLKLDQSDGSSNNQVGDRKFWSRHLKCREFIEQYAVSEEAKMIYDANVIVKAALDEVGYLEKKNGNLQYLYEKTANAGNANYTKYGYELKQAAPDVIDYPAFWCDCFVDWVFYHKYGKQGVIDLIGGFDDYTVASAQKYKDMGRWHSTPQVGDQIFFKNNERICHTGILYKVENATVYTVEGNTSGANTVVSNGGGVCKKSYPLSYARIAGYGRPRYTIMPTVNTNVQEGQRWLNTYYGPTQKKYLGTLISVDNQYGPKTRAACVCVWKDLANRRISANLTPSNDQFLGACKEAAKKIVITSGMDGTYPLIIQLILSAKGYYTGDMDTTYGDVTAKSIEAFQKEKGLQADGVVGPETWYALFN